jgi:hypothetical protein
VGGQNLALRDREVDFDLVQPTAVDGRVHDGQLGPPSLETCRARRAGDDPLSMTQKTRRADR